MSDITAEVMEGRAEAEAIMLSEGIIRRANGTTVTDPDTLEEIPGMDVIYPVDGRVGMCKIRFINTQPGVGAIPGASVTDQTAILSLPIDAPGSGNVTTGDIWECTANPMDQSLIGKKATITGVHSQTFATARRFPVSEVS